MFCPSGFCPVAQSDVYELGSSWGVQSERLGSCSSYFGSVEILLLELIVWRERFFPLLLRRIALLDQMTNVFFFFESICTES